MQVPAQVAPGARGYPIFPVVPPAPKVIMASCRYYSLGILISPSLHLQPFQYLCNKFPVLNLSCSKYLKRFLILCLDTEY